MSALCLQMVCMMSALLCIPDGVDTHGIGPGYRGFKRYFREQSTVMLCYPDGLVRESYVMLAGTIQDQVEMDKLCC